MSKRKILKPLVFCLALLLGVNVYANDFPFSKLSIEDGLSQGNINDILCDSLGLMWFATQDGLNLYDGYNFSIYKPTQKDGSISHNIVKCLYEDSEGTLWVGTAGGGLNRYNRTSNTFTSYINDPDNSESISDNNVYAIYEDSKKNLWVGTYGGGLNLFNRDAETFTHFLHNSNDSTSIGGNSVRSITEDSNGNLWVGVDEGGLNRFDKKKRTFIKYLHNPNDANSLCSNAVLKVFVDHEGMIWVGTWGGGVCVLNPFTNMFKHFRHDPLSSNSLNTNEVFDIYEDIKNDLWITTRMGLDKYERESGKFFHNTYDPLNDMSISHNLVSCLHEDKFGVLWIGTEGGGLNKLDLKRKKFHSLKVDFVENDELSSEDIFSVFEDRDGIIWIGTKGGGLNRFNPKTKEFSYFLTKKIEGTIGFTVIRSIDEDSKGNLWLGTDGSGVIKMNKKTGEYIRFTSEQDNSITNDAIYAIHCDNENKIWFGSYGGGLDVLNLNTMKFKNHPVNASNSMKNVVLCILEDNESRIWIGTAGMGLLVFDKEAEVFKNAEHYLKNKTAFSNNVISTLMQDRKGKLWIGTGGSGVDVLDIRTGMLDNISKKEGLPNEMIAGVLEDEGYNFWISSNNGLSKYESATGKIYNFTKEDGLQSAIFNLSSYAKAKNGTLYFGGINGVNYFLPDSIHLNPYEPRVILTDFKLFNKSVVPSQFGVIEKSITVTQSVDLSYDQNVITFEFAGLHYVNPYRNRYQYMLEGFDKDWVETSSQMRIATYTNLSGGNYVFKVRASNNDGEWSNETLSLKVTVNPPFWKTNWFYILVFVVILIAILVVMKVRERAFIHRQMELETKVKIRTEEINSQKEELQVINEQLNQQKEELRSQGDYLREINEQLIYHSEQLEEKQKQLEAFNAELAAKNSYITDSIQYAKKIQESILPAEAIFKRNFNDYFILFKPRDIVSGDFYWVAESKIDEWGKPSNKVIIAAVDCTGHGVPGAFMSMIGNTLLNEIVLTRNVQDPAQILTALNEEVNRGLAKEGQDIQDDGMDISICTIDKEIGQIEFCGAMQRIYVETDGEFKVLEGDLFSIGEMLAYIKKPKFAKQVLTFEESASIYLFSDGYQDQFGGPDVKKFKEGKLRELVKRIKGYDFTQQKNILEQTFEDWKGTRKQIDDVIVLGIHIKSE